MKGMEMSKIMSFIDVTALDNVQPGKTIHVESGGIEILLANVSGTIYAVSDRCGHQNAPLSKGILDGKIITCPLHYSQFDVTTGKLISGPVHPKMEGLDMLPQEFMKMMSHMGEITAPIKTHDLKTFPVKVEGKRIYVKV